MAAKKQPRKKKKNNYFTYVHQDAILEYTASEDPKHRRRREISKRVERDHLSIYNHYDEIREKEEFMKFLWKEIDRWEKQNLKENERRVLDAIKILFEDADNIEIFNKKAIYLYIREITSLNTKQVLNNLNRFRLEYANFKKKWND
jgi:hypothetical protein